MTNESGKIREKSMEMLEVVIAEKTISPLLKAYLHREIVELMKNKPASWGVALSNQLLTDYENLVNLFFYF